MFNLQLSKWRLSAVVILLLSVIPLSASSERSRTAGNESSAVDVQEMTLKAVFNYIEKNSNYIFIYDEKVNSMLGQKVSVSLEGRNVQDILKEVCSKASLVYSIDGRQIAVHPSAPHPEVSAEVEVYGTVLDETGLPLIGASVLIKGTSKGSITDIDGKYSLTVPAGSGLTISYIGYKDYVVNSVRGGR